MRLFSRGWPHPEGVLAEYLWGRSTLVLHPDAPIAGELLARTFAGLIARSLPISSDQDFRVYVGLLHELAHCLQDLTTGLGMSDLLCRMRMLPQALEAGRDATYGGEWKNRIAHLADEYERRSFVNTAGWRGAHELRLLERKIGGLVKDVSLFTAVTVLEVEAEISANMNIVGMKGSAEQLDIARRNHELYSPMSSPYAETVTEMLALLLPMPAPTRADVETALQVRDRIGPVLLDLALAVPPPSYLRDHRLDADDFHPGVRLVRMFDAYHRMSDLSAEERGAARDPDTLYPLLEDRSRKTPHYDYPPVRDIYDAWAREFDRLSVDARHFSATARWAAAVCRRRTLMDYRVWSRSPFEVMELELPFLIQAGNVREVHNLFGFSLTKEGEEVHLERESRKVSEAMMHVMLGMQPSFVCPRALEQGGCPVQTAACFTGISRLSAVPENEECLARQQLDAAAWNTRACLPEDAPSWA